MAVLIVVVVCGAVDVVLVPQAAQAAAAHPQMCDCCAAATAATACAAAALLLIGVTAHWRLIPESGVDSNATMLAPSSQLGVPCPKPSVLAPAARDPARLRAAGVSTSGGRLALRGSRLVGSHSINRSTRETVRGGRCMGIHKHTYPVPRLTGVQFWCPMQAWTGVGRVGRVGSRGA